MQRALEKVRAQTHLMRCALDLDQALQGHALALVVQAGLGHVVLVQQKQSCALLEPADVEEDQELLSADNPAFHIDGRPHNPRPFRRRIP